MRVLLLAAFATTSTLSACAPHTPPAAPPALVAAATAPEATATPAATPDPRIFLADPIWVLGTASATSGDLVAVRGHLPPSAWKQPAITFFKDVQLLHGADVETLGHAMRGIERSLGVKCTFCHTEKKFEADTDHKKIARQMLVMTDDLNRANFGGKAEITCWTCHHGEKEPQKTPKDMEARIAKAIPPAFDIPAADAQKPAREVFKNLQLLGNVPAGQIPYFMGFFSAALGEDCDTCHVKDDPASDDKEEKRVARDMMRMSLRASAAIDGTRGALTCWTCHRGDEHPERSPFPKPPSK